MPSVGCRRTDDVRVINAQFRGQIAAFPLGPTDVLCALNLRGFQLIQPEKHSHHHHAIYTKRQAKRVLLRFNPFLNQTHTKNLSKWTKHPSPHDAPRALTPHLKCALCAPKCEILNISANGIFNVSDLRNRPRNGSARYEIARSRNMCVCVLVEWASKGLRAHREQRTMWDILWSWTRWLIWRRRRKWLRMRISVWWDFANCI